MPNPKKYLLVLAFVQLLLLSAGAQNSLRFGRLSLEDGLSQSVVNCVVQDSSGFIWIGTQDGLNRYDGYEFTVFRHDPNDSSTISNNFIRALYVDEAGYIWIGTDNGLNQYDPVHETFDIYHPQQAQPNSLADNSVTAIVGDGSGGLWIGTADSGLDHFQVRKGLFTHYRYASNLPDALPSDAINTLLFDSKKNLWVGTAGGGLAVMRSGTDKFRSWRHIPEMQYSLPDDVVWDIFEDRSGRIWIATNNGVGRLANGDHNERHPLHPGFGINTKDGEFSILLHGQVVKSLCSQEDDVLWAGTDAAGLVRVLEVYQLDHITWDLQAFSYSHDFPAGLSSSSITDLMDDATGTLWIGTNRGINKFDPLNQCFDLFQDIPNQANSLAGSAVWAIHETANRNLWVGTRRGLNRFTPQTGRWKAWTTIANEPTLLNNGSVFAIEEDSTGTLWLGTAAGLFKATFNAADNAAFVPVEYGAPALGPGRESRVYVLQIDRHSNLWVGTKNGLGRLELKSGKVQFFESDGTNPNSLSDNTIRAIYEDSKGTVWVGTEDGLCKVLYDSKGDISFEVWKPGEAEATENTDMILSIWEDQAGILWLGTYGGGLGRFDPSTGDFTSITRKDGLPNNVVYGVLGDAWGYLWLSTNQGIAMYSPETGAIRGYDEANGLQSNEFSFGAFHKGQSGFLYFGGINGFNRFDPALVKNNARPPGIALTKLLVNNQQIKPSSEGILKKSLSKTEHITLPPTGNSFSIEFAALHFSAPQQNTYQYKLVGFQDEWVHAETRRVATYTNLDPGDYEFQVRAYNPDGVQSLKTASIAIEVLPPIYRTWWFRILFLLLILGMAYAIYQARVRSHKHAKLELQEQVRQRTAEVLKQKEQIEQQKAELEAEKEKSEKLLLNLLPQQTVDELKFKGKARARHYRSVTIMFTDFKSFTKIAERMKPAELVANLDNYFVKFDEIITRHNIEKIKTMGDAYMCAGGIPIRNKSNSIDVVLAGLKIQRFMLELEEQYEADSGNTEKDEPWQLRIGIHTGEIIAGVIGINRFAYDIWGDSVNIAKRMETSCIPGKVNISGRTYNRIRDFFDCTHRGKIQAKNKGEVDMYFVDRIKPEFSADAHGIEPNDRFWEYVNLQLYSSINYTKAERYIIRRLKKELSRDLLYHSVAHTRDVCEAAERIARSESIKGEDLFLLKTAALYHDAGFVKQYQDNEDIGAQMARDALPRYGYTEAQIDLVDQLIKATKVPQRPQTHLQEVICDADLDYLGRDDFWTISDFLMKELMAFGMIKSHKQWDEIQVKFLEQHRYFTKTNIQSRQPKKMEHLEAIKQRLIANDYPAETA